MHILTEFEEHELIVLDDAVKVVLGDHQDAILDLDFGEANRGEAKHRETKFADEAPHADRNLLFRIREYSLLVASRPFGEPSRNDTVRLVDEDGRRRRQRWRGRDDEEDTVHEERATNERTRRCVGEQ